MKRPYQVTAVVFMLFAAFMARESLELKFYTSLGPGPGFFPFWLSLIFGALSATMFYHATWGKSDPMPADFFPQKIGYIRMGAIVLALIGVILLLNHLGFRITMLAFYLFLLFALGRVNLIATVAVALAGSFGVYHVFVEWLKVPLPVGMFGI